MDREGILEEIRRTASESGGVPLGEKRFSDVTGIPRRDWYGKYWARWGDAVREAGFEPNLMQGSYDIEYLLSRYGSLARRLGRLPTPGECRVEHSTDATFPDYTVFEKRFGSKAALASKLLDFCRDSRDYSDVVELCEAYSPRRVKKPEAVPPVAVLGAVYLIKSGRHYKIGRSNSAGRRHYELSIQLPERATLVHAIETDDPIGIEAYWHKRFESKRANGEWFSLTAEDVAAFKRRRSFM